MSTEEPVIDTTPKQPGMSVVNYNKDDEVESITFCGVTMDFPKHGGRALEATVDNHTMKMFAQTYEGRMIRCAVCKEAGFVTEFGPVLVCMQHKFEMEKWKL